MAKLFGDTDIAVYQEDIHVDHNTHELVVEAHEDGHVVQRVATEGPLPEDALRVMGVMEAGKDVRVVEDEKVARRV